jgi:diacylglycerol kinase family enzyme
LHDAIHGNLDAVVVAGGDGTISTVAGVLIDSGIPLGIVPLGTFNHFAQDAGIPLGLEDAVAVIAAGCRGAVDLAEANGRVFINNSSIGIYPYLVVDRERRRRRAGLPKWLAMLFAVVRTFRYFPLRRLRIRTPDREEAFRSPCVFVGNNVYRIAGPGLGTRDRLDGGELCVRIAKQHSRLALLWLAVRSFLGVLDQQRDLRTFNLPDVEISSRSRKLLVSFDGEVEVLRSPLRYRVRPGALRLCVPSAAGSR